MNYLTRLYFSDLTADQSIGLVIGNSAKDRHLVKYNQDILKGIAMDLRIRNFSENHPAFLNSVQRSNKRYSSYAPVLVNIFFDHFLAKNWKLYSTQSLEEFASRIYSCIVFHWNAIPLKNRKFALEMIENKYITGMTGMEGTHKYINYISNSERLPTFVDQGLYELIENYQQYKDDFEEFFAALCKFMEEVALQYTTTKKAFTLLSA